MKRYRGICRTPLGVIAIEGTKEGVSSIHFLEQGEEKKLKKTACLNYETRNCKRQIYEYFQGQRKNFNVKMVLEGTEFQKKVWDALCHIPYGKTASYREIAEQIESPKSVRAVGGANNKNKLPIVIPCHRIIGSDGKMTGYAAGLWRKEWLLEHEKRMK